MIKTIIVTSGRDSDVHPAECQESKVQIPHQHYSLYHKYSRLYLYSQKGALDPQKNINEQKQLYDVSKTASTAMSMGKPVGDKDMAGEPENFSLIFNLKGQEFQSKLIRDTN